jgi:hypothetical protein
MSNAAQAINNESTNLRVGRRIYCSLYGGKYGTISAVHGIPDQGNFHRAAGGVLNMVTGPEAHIDVVWDHGATSQQVPECICTGIQWNFLDEPDRSQADIDEALAYAEQKRVEAEEAKAAQERAFVAKVQALRSCDYYADLEQSSREGGTDKTKLAAKNIRKLLKKAHPSVKFSVRKDGYSTLWVTWPRAVEGEEVNQRTINDLIGRFQTGYYDPEQDLSGSSDSAFNIVFGGVNHITMQCHFD